MKLAQLIILFFTLLSLLISCNKSEVDDNNWKEGYVINDGSPAVDGCGWVISIQNTRYEPKQILDSVFLVDSIKVLVDYKLTGNNGMYCWGSLQQISINKIKRR